MKRLMSTALINALSANPNCTRADCITITLPNGATMNATDGQFDITIPKSTLGWSGNTTTFSANLFGVWSRGPITSEANFDLSSNTCDLTAIMQQSTAFPGNLGIGMLQAALKGLFDAAQVSIVTAYFAIGSYGTLLADSVETKFVGQANKPKISARNKMVLTCADPCFLLNQQLPQRILASNCCWSFADKNCNPPGGAGAFTVQFAAAAGTTASLMIPATPFTGAAGIYTQGVVKCLSGANAGLSQYVILHNASGQLQLNQPWIVAPKVGDSFSVIQGCDKSATTCTQKFNNLVNFSGQPFTPVSTQAV
jgi:uncharacterized phage protein (TIGR02218 family)